MNNHFFNKQKIYLSY